MKINDQGVLVELWKNNTCLLEPISSAMQSFEASKWTQALVNPMSLLLAPAFHHFTQAEDRASLCKRNNRQKGHDPARVSWLSPLWRPVFSGKKSPCVESYKMLNHLESKHPA